MLAEMRNSEHVSSSLEDKAVQLLLKRARK